MNTNNVKPVKKSDPIAKKRKFVNNELIPFMQQQLKDKSLQILHVTNEDCDGYCYTDKKTIYIDPKAKLLSTFIHEVLHLMYPKMSENNICYLELALIEALTKKQIKDILMTMMAKLK